MLRAHRPKLWCAPRPLRPRPSVSRPQAPPLPGPRVPRPSVPGFPDPGPPNPRAPAARPRTSGPSAPRPPAARPRPRGPSAPRPTSPGRPTPGTPLPGPAALTLAQTADVCRAREEHGSSRLQDSTCGRRGRKKDTEAPTADHGSPAVSPAHSPGARVPGRTRPPPSWAQRRAPEVSTAAPQGETRRGGLGAKVNPQDTAATD